MKEGEKEGKLSVEDEHKIRTLLQEGGQPSDPLLMCLLFQKKKKKKLL